MPPTQLHHPSPKRKRDQPPPAPLLNTALRPLSTPPRGSPAPLSGADSPRNAVADQLRSMTLVSDAAISILPLSPTDDLVHKKPKLDEMSIEDAKSLDEDAAKTKTVSWKNSHQLDTIASMSKLDTSLEIPETPQAIQPRISPDIASFAQPATFGSPSKTTILHPHISPSYKSRTQNRSSSFPRPRNRSSSPPVSVLTWKDSEITGHLADPSTDPDDDGTGLNGIGFKPTPAIAYARSQRRRKQLSEWKARETREARAKRSERRRRGVGGAKSVEATAEKKMALNEVDTVKRMVKFAV